MAGSLAEPQAHEARPGTFTALVWVNADVAPWLPAIARLLELPDLDRALLAIGETRSIDQLPDDPRIEVVGAPSFAEVVRDLPNVVSGPVLLMTAPVLLPEMGLGSALDAMAGDARIAAVSFLSNAAGHLSFPHRNRGTQYAFEGHDETTLTRLLRSSEPVLLPAPIAATAGGATLVSRDCVVLTKGPSGVFTYSPESSVTEMVMRAQRRGLRAVLDPATYVTRIWEGHHWEDTPLEDEPIHRRIAQLHPQVMFLHEQQRRRADSALQLSMSTARAKVRGLRILIDASCLGPIENGTQVQTLALIEALSRRSDVKWIGVGMNGNVPRYAQEVLAHPKVRMVKTQQLRFPDGNKADILHRPFQPGGPLPWANWQKSAERVVVTLQDLIAYSVGAYHDRPRIWMKYRRGIQQSVAKSDGLVVISHDVDGDLRGERLPLVSDRSSSSRTAPTTSAATEAERFPRRAAAHGVGGTERFLVVLGANYAHKNRDLAIRRGAAAAASGTPTLGLVLVGAAVPSRRVEPRSTEAIELARHRRRRRTCCPTSRRDERNWLLRHAEAVVYPTSAEGFGLVPFEAARFGTPTRQRRLRAARRGQSAATAGSPPSRGTRTSSPTAIDRAARRPRDWPASGSTPR